jgi:DNA-binding NarL/FixJ family response regulator
MKNVQVRGPEGQRAGVPEDALKQLLIDQWGLTVCQARVVALLAQGLQEKGVSGRIKRSVDTVHYHVKNVYGHRGLHDRGELLREVYRLMAEADVTIKLPE